MRKIRLVTIDFDDTLCLTEKAAFRLENSIAKSMGFKPQSRKIHKKTWGKPLPNIAPVRFPGINVSKFIDRVGEEMKSLSEENLFDVVSDQNLKVLDNLKERGFELAILTSRIFKEVEHLLSKKNPLMLRISKDNFFYRERFQYRKPDPRIFRDILKSKKLKPEEVVYVGDSITDAVCAKLGGVSFIANLESGLRKRKDFEKNLVDSFITRFSNLNYAIKKIVAKAHEKKGIPKIDVILSIKGQEISVPHDYFLKKCPEVKYIIEEIESPE